MYVILLYLYLVSYLPFFPKSAKASFFILKYISKEMLGFLGYFWLLFELN